MNESTDIDLAAEQQAAEVKQRATRRQEFIGALQALAQFLYNNPDVDAPRCVQLNVFVDSREDLARHARVSGWEKVYMDNFFVLRREFSDDLQLDITADRSTICRRVVTGTRVVPAQPAQPEREEEVAEWVCDDEPLLENGGSR